MNYSMVTLNIIVLLSCLNLYYCQTANNQELDYYDNLVTDSRAEALNYNLPRNAREFYSENYNKKANVSGMYLYIVIGAGSAGAVVANRLSENPNATVLLLEAGVAENDFVDIPGMFAFVQRTKYNWGFRSTPQTTACLGAGSAGAVVANRLSENPNATVLLLEAGVAENDFVDIPGMFAFVQRTKYNWGFRSTPQTTACLGLIDNMCPIPRGKGLGGTTILNGLVYTRGNKGDYDRWEAEGNKGWSYKDVLPYFLKSENASFLGADPGYHSQSGTLHVEKSSYESEQMKAYLKANNELGYSTLDYNGENEIGVSKAQLNTLNGRRFTTADAFLTAPIRKRKNLKISTNSFVTKILIHNLTKIAYGVEYMQNGQKNIAIALREIVLSAGSFLTPQILMLSGVGPKEHLKAHKIGVIADLPVGNGLLDQPMLSGLNILSNASLPFQTQREYLAQYLNGTGYYTLPGGNEGVGFYRVDNSMQGIPDYEMMLLPPNRTGAMTQFSNRYTNETYNAVFANLNPISTFTIYVIALEAISQGSIRLNSSSPFDYPLIDLNILSDKEDKDINVIYNGLQNLIRLLETDAFKRINATIDTAVLPACKNLTYLSKEFWVCTIRHLSKGMNHSVGTCKMGSNSTSSVVDNKLRVHGIRKLRIADGSIMPSNVAGHPSVPITMIGERVSEFIKFG